MEIAGYALASVAGLTVLVFIAWRLASRRQSLPCPVWLRWLVELDNPLTKTNRAAFIIERLEIETGMTVVDVGCGPGRLAIPAAVQVGPHGRVVAMDIQPGMLSRTQKKAEAANLGNIECLQAGAGEGKLGQEQFDRVLLVTVLGEIPDREAALREIFEALKPDGVLSVTETMFDPHYQSRRSVALLAGAVGFRERAFFGNRLAYTLHLEKNTERTA